MREQIFFELDIEVKERLEQWGKECGWDLDETLRYILGREASMIPSLTVGPRRALRRSAGTEDNLDPETVNKAMLRALVGTGAIKCKNCFKQLSTDDVIAGECPQCGEKI